MSESTLFGYRLREGQSRILGYSGGRVAVSAVPGSGKTLTLALLAVKLITEGRIGGEGEVLVVTVQNAAVENISQRIKALLQDAKLPPVGYRVCTLHKLAADILRERCDLAGVEEGFFIVDEVERHRIIRSAADTWIASEHAYWQSVLPTDNASGPSRLEKAWRDQTEKIGKEVTKLCKHFRLSPEDARALVANSGEESPFLRMGVGIYSSYAKYLQARIGLDFDDLIWRAIEAIEGDATFLANLHARWPYVLEDEAQDSSPLQESILDRLSGADGNWVRVGDPNQSINSTFTTADPRYFRRFLERDDTTRMGLGRSGRSGRPIIAVANHLVNWVCNSHPEPQVRQMAFLAQDILPTDEADRQQNPEDSECAIYLRRQPFGDVDLQGLDVARWAAAYIGNDSERSAAVLCPAEWQGGKVITALQKMVPPVPFDDMLKSTPQARSVAKLLAAVCAYLGKPTSQRHLAALAEEGHLGDPPSEIEKRALRTLVLSLPLHELLFPRVVVPLPSLLPASLEVGESEVSSLGRLASLVSRWVRASSLPIDQLLMTVAQDLFTQESDLALCHAMASSLRSSASMHPLWRLADFGLVLDEIARNRRAFRDLALAESGYHETPGRVVITTMHKAKGLEWDAVYLICVDSLEFPDGLDDSFRDEPYYLPGRAPIVEARKRLERLVEAPFAGIGENTPVDEARLETISERLRLLYVGITRARRNLAFTWCEKNGRRTVRMAAPLEELGRTYGRPVSEKALRLDNAAPV